RGDREGGCRPPAGPGREDRHGPAALVPAVPDRGRPEGARASESGWDRRNQPRPGWGDEWRRALTRPCSGALPVEGATAADLVHGRHGRRGGAKQRVPLDGEEVAARRQRRAYRE